MSAENHNHNATTNEIQSIRSRIDFVKPNTADNVHKKQNNVPNHVGSNIQDFKNGQPILVHDYREERR